MTQKKNVSKYDVKKKQKGKAKKQHMREREFVLHSAFDNA